MMQVKNINWINEPAAECEVEISDGTHTCHAFSQPCAVVEGDHIVGPLHVFGIKSPMLSAENEVRISLQNAGCLGHVVIAKIVDVSAQILEVGGIQLIVDEDLPKGLNVDDLVEFECARIDLW